MGAYDRASGDYSIGQAFEQTPLALMLSVADQYATFIDERKKIMGNLKRFIVDIDTLEILKQGNIEGNTYYLPKTQLERSKYDAVNKVLVALGAKWNKKANGHVFDYDITESFNQVLETGIVTDWKKINRLFYTPKNVVNEMLGLVVQPKLAKIKLLEPSAGRDIYLI